MAAMLAPRLLARPNASKRSWSGNSWINLNCARCMWASVCSIRRRPPTCIITRRTNISYRPATQNYSPSMRGLKCAWRFCWRRIRYPGNRTLPYFLVCAPGDPSLLHPDATPRSTRGQIPATYPEIHLPFGPIANWRGKPLGKGWAWDDYNEDFMAERSPLPVYGNRIRGVEEGPPEQQKADPAFEPSPSVYSIPEVDWEVRFTYRHGTKRIFCTARQGWEPLPGHGRRRGEDQDPGRPFYHERPEFRAVIAERHAGQDVIADVAAAFSRKRVCRCCIQGR